MKDIVLTALEQGKRGPDCMLNGGPISKNPNCNRYVAYFARPWNPRASMGIRSNVPPPAT